MAKITQIQTNFTAGELSPRVQSRIDVAKYNNGLKISENVRHYVQGGVGRREGLRKVAETKDSGAKKSRLIPFIYNRDQAYMLEVGESYIRVFKDGAAVGAPYEIATPWTEAMLFDISYQGGQDSMFMVQESVYPQRLQRFGDAEWQLLPLPTQVEPFDELGIKPTTTLTLSAATVGTGRTATAGAALFAASDVGRDIVYGAGLGTITGFSTSTAVTVEIKSAFSGVSLPSGGWTLDGTPQASCTVSAVGPVGTSVTVTLSADGWGNGGARGSEIGKYVRVNGGLVKLTGYTSGTVMQGIVQQVLTSTVAAVANSWTLNSSIWGNGRGYPRAVCLQDQRLLLAGSPAYSQSIAASRIGNVLNFELATGDSDAYLRELSTTQVAPIQHLVPSKRLLVLTNSNEMSLRGGQEKPITPTNIQKDDETERGASRVRPVKIGKEVMFVQRAGVKVRACGYAAQIEGYESPDRTVFSEHITKPGVVDMAYQQEPDALLACVRSDGQMAVAAYDLEQEVNAWGRWITDGVIESVATIPTPTSEQTWVIVKRTINGVDRRFVEYFDAALYTDCAVTGTALAGATTLPVPHLEGKTVALRLNGLDAGDFTVTGGVITLAAPIDTNGTTWEAGLKYTPRIRMLNPEVGSANGTSQGASISVGEVVVRVLDTVSVNVNGRNQTDFRRFNDRLLDRPPEVGTGDLRSTTLSGDLYRNEIEISQPRPVAFHVLSVIRKITVND